MSAAPAISIENVSKRYKLTARRSDGLRHILEEALKHPLRTLRGKKAGLQPGEFWALKSIHSQVVPGEVLGLIGKNGAGKSTLLKILSRITEPTSGAVRLRGRVASLLEVGTGFHPDLSGRENIFLNGAILGMTRAEIRRKFDEIVAFAEIERFLDTPVKRYSSGMYVRLAFAVAAHLEPEILLVDEVLAVGDAAFQKKCLGKMNEVSTSQGRTVLFVSHNMAAIRTLCTRALYLEKGRVAHDGSPEECIRKYLEDSFPVEDEWRASPNEHPLQVTRLRLVTAGDSHANCLEASDSFRVEIEYEVRRPVRNALVEFWILASDGAHLMTFGEHDANVSALEERQPGRYVVHVQVPGNLLNTGTYYIRVNSGIAHHCTFDHADAIRFEIVESRPENARQNRRGYIIPLVPWQTVNFEPLDAPDSQVA